MWPTRRWLAVATAAGLSLTAAGDVIMVGPGDSIQDAIDIASDADEIIVAPGTYFEVIDLSGKAIKLHSSGGAAVTIIDGSGLNASVVTCRNGEGPDTVIEGFTITGGFGTEIELSPGFCVLVGGGMYCDGSRPTVLNCDFLNNYAEFGGGVFNRNGANGFFANCTLASNCAFDGAGMGNVGSSPRISDCIFDSNFSFCGGGLDNCAGSSPTLDRCVFSTNFACFGAGVTNGQSSPVLRDCTFSDNFAKVEGAGMYNVESTPRLIGCTFVRNNVTGIFNDDSDAVVVGCSFVGNSSFDTGGMNNVDGSDAAVINCSFLGNDGILAGGLRAQNSSPVIVNCLFAGNSMGNAGGLAIEDFRPGSPGATVANCSFVGNTGALAGGILDASDFSNTTIANCVVWNNSPTQITDSGGLRAIVMYSDVEGGLPGAGNIDADPLFVDPDGPDDDPATLDDNDYRLSLGSPCGDAGHNWAVPSDIADLDGNGDAAELTPVDLVGNPRFVADEIDFDPGCGVPVVVDMGAYEFRGGPADVILGDLDGDGVVATGDLLALLVAWGPCPEDCCLADLDLDGAVGVIDLLLLLANWS